jgi:hypothetical protein
MVLDDKKLEKLMTNKYLVVVTGNLTKHDRRIVLKTLSKYNKRNNYVGEHHVESFFCDDINQFVRARLKIKSDTSIIFIKDGFVEYVEQGVGDLFYSDVTFENIIIGEFGIFVEGLKYG